MVQAFVVTEKSQLSLLKNLSQRIRVCCCAEISYSGMVEKSAMRHEPHYVVLDYSDFVEGV